MQFSFWSAFQTFNSSWMLQLALIQFDFMAHQMEPIDILYMYIGTSDRSLASCKFSVVGSCVDVHKDFFSIPACLEIWRVASYRWDVKDYFDTPFAGIDLLIKAGIHTSVMFTQWFSFY